MRARRAALWTLVAAKLLTGWGLAWDIQWHVQIGRDTFWIAPHVMMYAGVSAAVVVSFAVLVADTLRGDIDRRVRVLGLRSTRGFHLAAWGMALVVAAAPIDDLWHRLFGIDVTLWSPPHLLGLGGSVVNALGCVAIAAELYPAGSRARLAGVLVTGALLYGGVRVVLDPAYLLAFQHGGVLFHAFPMLAALCLPLPFLVVARLADHRSAPVATLALAIVIGISGDLVARAGFAVLEPESVIGEAIKQDPTSDVARANAIEERNRGVPRPWWSRYYGLVAAAAMALVDVRRRPVAATLAWSAVLFALSGWYLAARPAFEPLVPGPGETILALGLTSGAAIAGAAVARVITGWLERPATTSPGR